MTLPEVPFGPEQPHMRPSDIAEKYSDLLIRHTEDGWDDEDLGRIFCLLKDFVDYMADEPIFDWGDNPPTFPMNSQGGEKTPPSIADLARCFSEAISANNVVLNVSPSPIMNLYLTNIFFDDNYEQEVKEYMNDFYGDEGSTICDELLKEFFTRFDSLGSANSKQEFDEIVIELINIEKDLHNNVGYNLFSQLVLLNEDIASDTYEEEGLLDERNKAWIVLSDGYILGLLQNPEEHLIELMDIMSNIFDFEHMLWVEENLPERNIANRVNIYTSMYAQIAQRHFNTSFHADWQPTITQFQEGFNMPGAGGLVIDRKKKSDMYTDN